MTATVDTERWQASREVIAAVLSGAILVTAAWAFMRTFESGSVIFAGDSALAAKEAFERQKDLLTLALGLLGTVTGYYLGRAPAELRAGKAQNAADKARAEPSSANSVLPRRRQPPLPQRRTASGSGMRLAPRPRRRCEHSRNRPRVPLMPVRQRFSKRGVASTASAQALRLLRLLLNPSRHVAADFSVLPRAGVGVAVEEQTNGEGAKTPGISVSVIMIIGVSPYEAHRNDDRDLPPLTPQHCMPALKRQRSSPTFLDAGDVVGIGARAALAIGAAGFASSHRERADEAHVTHAFAELPLRRQSVMRYRRPPRRARNRQSIRPRMPARAVW